MIFRKCAIKKRLIIVGNQIKRVSKFKFHAITIDEHLTWVDHIMHTMSCKSKPVSCLYALNPIRSHLSRQCLRMLYNSLVLPHPTYPMESFYEVGSANQSLINKISIMQKKAIETVTRSNYIAHTDPQFAELKTLKLRHINNYTLRKYM